MASDVSNIEANKFTEQNLQKEESSAIMKMNIDDKNGTWTEAEVYTKPEIYTKSEDYKMQLKWFNIIYITSLHLFFIYSCFTFKFFENLKTTAWMYIMYMISGIGITAGIHRLWSHKSYKAKWPLRIILVIFYASAGMNNIYKWVRDHRVHHKYVGTDADPHNSNRGFFFSHVGWLMVKKHPEVIRRGHQVDMSDLLADPITAFSIKYFTILKFLCAYLLPIMLPVYGWNETWSRAFVSQIGLRYIFVLNVTWSINSVAHMWGSKPYDMSINSANNQWISALAVGEGWHNYHHVFPWDYKAAELPSCFQYNFSAKFIEFFAKIGWAYDLKQSSKELVKTIVIKRGDGSHPLWSAVPHPASKIK